MRQKKRSNGVHTANSPRGSLACWLAATCWPICCLPVKGVCQLTYVLQQCMPEGSAENRQLQMHQPDAIWPMLEEVSGSVALTVELLLSGWQDWENLAPTIILIHFAT